MTASPSTVGSVAARSAAAARVLTGHGLDICCGGSRPFEEACAASGLAPGEILAEVEIEEEASPVADPRWNERPLPDVIRHLVDHHHQPVRREIPRLQALAWKVARVHADHDGVRLHALAGIVDGLAEDLFPHLDREEQILFPWIASGRGASAGTPIGVMQSEHESAGRSLEEIRRLTDDHTVPAGACTSWRSLLDGLAAFDADLREHIHLENNVLFPRALATRPGVAG
jgi:regulator of cell morphogenesis and NO signaling